MGDRTLQNRWMITSTQLAVKQDLKSGKEQMERGRVRVHGDDMANKYNYEHTISADDDNRIVTDRKSVV